VSVVACGRPTPHPVDRFPEPVAEITPRELVAQLVDVTERSTAIELARLHDDDLADDALLITFDGPYREHVEHTCPILRRLAVPAVLFVPTDCIEHRRLPDVDRVQWLLERTERRRIALRYPTSIELDLAGDPARVGRLLRRMVVSRYGLDLERFVDELARACGIPWSEELERDIAAERILTWDEVTTLHRAGLTIAPLGASGRRWQLLSLTELHEELVRARTILSRRLGEPVMAAAAPLTHPDDILHPPLRTFERAGYRIGFAAPPGTSSTSWLHQRAPLSHAGESR
jgi:peptidoglycan/xylan/chitin deacetylase (PgdA/CDA1 family)